MDRGEILKLRHAERVLHFGHTEQRKLFGLGLGHTKKLTFENVGQDRTQVVVETPPKITIAGDNALQPTSAKIRWWEGTWLSGHPCI